ncbi:MAG: hypothetical protein AAFQ41_14190, partial [Cyanobacteria bacterium J06623_7]
TGILVLCLYSPLPLYSVLIFASIAILSHWNTYVADASYLTQRGGTFLYDESGELLYEHRDRNILGFAANMSAPLSFIDKYIPVG